jgi:hypothetical protein
MTIASPKAKGKMCFFKTPFPIGKIIQERIKMFLEHVFELKMVDES